MKFDNMAVPFHRPSIGEEEEKEVIDTLRSGWITTGPKTKKFEREFAEYCRTKYAIAVNSCTAALHLGLHVANVGPGDEVITSPITWPSTANVIVHQGAKPVFVDVKPDTLNIDPARITEYIEEQEKENRLRVKAIIPVHFAGQPCDMDPILEIAQKYNLIVIEDAAHALETEYKGRKVGNIGDITAFSFYATKNITTGEGGMLTTNSAELAEKASVMSLHGISKDAWKRYGSEGYHHWELIYPGYKYNMFDIQAALGLHQLKKVEEFWERRKLIVEEYNHAFADVPNIVTLPDVQNGKSAFHLYVIRVKTEDLTADRDTIMNAIQGQGIGIGIHFRAAHLQPYYRRTFGFKRGDLPKAEYAADRVISLPLYPGLADKEVLYITKAVKEIIQTYQGRKQML
jgi:dTDP-4-amino-4,6-dideoxygalactose transaminase